MKQTTTRQRIQNLALATMFMDLGIVLSPLRMTL